ncbi:hypothetical protein BH23GEM8_BH23GEM8_00390 [soil metagenome]
MRVWGFDRIRRRDRPVAGLVCLHERYEHIQPVPFQRTRICIHKGVDFSQGRFVIPLVVDQPNADFH